MASPEDRKKAAKKRNLKRAETSLRTAQAVFSKFLVKADPASQQAVTSRN